MRKLSDQLNEAVILMSASRRFWAKVDQSAGAGNCWPWTGCVNSDGYGCFHVDGKIVRATRIAWQYRNGARVPDSLMVLHTCDNPSCCNPVHLFLGDNGVNMRDARDKGRLRNPNTEKTHCVHGHEFTEANTYRYDGGPNRSERRRCRTCERERGQRKREHAARGGR